MGARNTDVATGPDIAYIFRGWLDYRIFCEFTEKDLFFTHKNKSFMSNYDVALEHTRARIK